MTVEILTAVNSALFTSRVGVHVAMSLCGVRLFGVYISLWCTSLWGVHLFGVYISLGCTSLVMSLWDFSKSCS